MKVILIAVGALVVGAAIGIALCQATIRYLQRRVRELRKGKASVSILQSVTKLLFVTTQLCALGWVSVSYGIAVYSTVRLRQPFPVVELSQQAITTILGVNVLKVVENIFEHMMEVAKRIVRSRLGLKRICQGDIRICKGKNGYAVYYRNKACHPC